MWDEFSKIPFPKPFPEVKGKFDLGLVDSLSAGIITRFLQKEKLSVNDKELLFGTKTNLEKAIPQLSGQSKKYFEKLSEIVKIVLKESKF